MTGKKTLIASSLTVCSASTAWAMTTGSHPAVANPDIPQRTDTNWDLELVTQEARQHFLTKMAAMAEIVEGKPLTYQVKSGDTLFSIGQFYGVSHQDLAVFNQIHNPDRIQVGQKLKIPLIPKLIRIKKGDTFQELIKKYQLKEELIAYLNPTYQEGREIQPGEPFMIVQRKSVERPKPKVVHLAHRTKVMEEKERPLRYEEGSFQWPVSGTLTSEYGMRRGRMHQGIDIWTAAETSQKIQASKSGVVVRSGYVNGYGNLVVLDHGNGWTTYYAHLSQIRVSRGQTIDTGQWLGNMGSTGNSTGPHLHFEIRKDGRALNPLQFLP